MIDGPNPKCHVTTRYTHWRYLSEPRHGDKPTLCDRPDARSARITKRERWTRLACIAVIVGCIAAAVIPEVADAWSPTEKVVICHATGSSTNPYVEITVSEAGAYHGHTGSSHQDGRDIIPPYDDKGTVYSQNWTEQGRATWANHCKPVKPTPPPVVLKYGCDGKLIPAGGKPPTCPGPERVVYRDRIVEKPVERVVTVERLVPSPPTVVTRWRTRIKRVVKTRRVVRYRNVCRRPDPSPVRKPRFVG